MKLNCTPEIKETERSVKFYLNDDQWNLLRNAKFNGLWFFVRSKGGE